MASEYNVSPETIRRAMHLLADMKVVEIKPQSGIYVLSADSARRYLETFQGNTVAKALRQQLVDQISAANELYHQIRETLSALLKSQSTFASANEPLPNYELAVSAASPLIGKSIGTLNFWQCTGATIVAIRRSQTVIVSPGPYAELYAGDVLVVVGNEAAIGAAANLIDKGGFYDSV